MKLYYHEEYLEAGIDEVARGCLLGRVYSAAVIWPKENDPDIDHPIMKDSKKLSAQKRVIMRDYIFENAIDYSVGYADENVIDKINILNATYNAMHSAIGGLSIDLDYLIVDGNKFKPYMNKDGDLVPHKCVINGDANYYAIAAASILAKVEHDEYIQNLCEEYPELDERYDLLSNMGYGTEKHIEGIKKYGISQFHRRSFGICQSAQIKKV
tara:strand:- start:626 stop:1261 length:636 start_codon:yes stop_codon:yes gene_type:complete